MKRISVRFASSLIGSKILLGLLLIFLLFSPATSLKAAQVILAWDPDLYPDVAGYRVYYGTTSGSYQFKVDAAFLNDPGRAAKAQVMPQGAYVVK